MRKCTCSSVGLAMAADKMNASAGSRNSSCAWAGPANETTAMARANAAQKTRIASHNERKPKIIPTPKRAPAPLRQLAAPTLDNIRFSFCVVATLFACRRLITYPFQIGLGPTCNRHDQDFRHLVGMQLGKTISHGRKRRLSRLDDKWNFLGSFELSLPHIHGQDWRTKVHAGSQTFFDQHVRDALGQQLVGCIA